VEHALGVLVETAQRLGIGWLTIQEPSGGSALKRRARELASRRIALAFVPGANHRGPAARDLALVESPILRVLLAEGRTGRRELVAAVQALADRGVPPKDVTEAVIAEALGLPDVDLLVLTGGDRRVPDLLVWQVAYSEIVVLDEPWPEVSAELVGAAVAEYQRRDRRYGGLVASR
jgi:hypothetical protein